MRSSRVRSFSDLLSESSETPGVSLAKGRYRLASSVGLPTTRRSGVPSVLTVRVVMVMPSVDPVTLGSLPRRVGETRSAAW